MHIPQELVPTVQKLIALKPGDKLEIFRKVDMYEVTKYPSFERQVFKVGVKEVTELREFKP